MTFFIGSILFSNHLFYLCAASKLVKIVASSSSKPVIVSTEKAKPTTSNPKLKYITDADSDIDDNYDDNEDDGKFCWYCFSFNSRGIVQQS